MIVHREVTSTSIPEECTDHCASAQIVIEGLQRFEDGEKRVFKGEKAAFQELGSLIVDCSGNCESCPLGGLVAVKAFLRSQEALATAKEALEISQKARSRASSPRRSDFWEHTGDSLG